MKAKIIVTLYIKNVTGAFYTVNYNENTLSVSVNAAWNNYNYSSSRSSKVIDLGVNRELICNYLLVTNRNYGRVSNRFRDIAFSSDLA